MAKELKKAGVNEDTLFGDQSHSGVIRAFLTTDSEMNRMNPMMTDVSGSTCIAVVVMKNRLISANLGDSCAGLLTMDQDNWELKMLNREHKPNEKDERDRVESSGGRVEPFRGTLK